MEVTGTLIPRPTLEAMSPVSTLETEELTYRGIERPFLARKERLRT